MNNKLNEMWTALATYQPKADANGHGESWALMCSEKTSSTRNAAAKAAYAAYDAAYAAYAADAAADAAFSYAAYAADAYADAAYAADAIYYINNAIYYINRANAKFIEPSGLDLVKKLLNLL